MASVILISVIFGILLYNLYKYMTFRSPNFPPGPPRIPIFGGYIWLLLLNYKHFQKAINILCKYYQTNILGMYHGNIPLIALNDAETVKEALFHRDFDGKPPFHLAKARHQDYQIKGIFFTEGPFWKQQRRYALRHLRDYGFGRRFEELEIDISEEIAIMIDMIKNGPKYEHEKEFVQNGNVACPQAFIACPSNCFLKTLCNERLARHDNRKLFEAGKRSISFQTNSDSFGKIFSVIPILGTMFSEITGFGNVRGSSLYLYDFIKELFDEQLATYDPNHVRSIIDMYIKEIKEAELNEEESFFFYEQLIQIGVDFFFPPSSAIPVTVTFFLQKLVLYPEVQRKIQAEIDDVVGQGRLPTLDDRINLPYTEATIREVMRIETLVPNGLPHSTLEDTSFRGYDIPKGTIVMPILNGLHMDPMKWDHPLEFKPERMLGADGKISLQKDYSLPFGAGKRLCAGETFARNMVFLMGAALVQSFNVKRSPNTPLPTETITSLALYLPDFQLKFVSR